MRFRCQMSLCQRCLLGTSKIPARFSHPLLWPPAKYCKPVFYSATGIDSGSGAGVGVADGNGASDSAGVGLGVGVRVSIGVACSCIAWGEGEGVSDGVGVPDGAGVGVGAGVSTGGDDESQFPFVFCHSPFIIFTQ